MRAAVQFLTRLFQTRPSAELIVVPVIVVLVLVVAVPLLMVRREQARQLQKNARIRDLGVSLNAYHDLFGSYPAQVPTKRQPARPRPKPAELISPL